jgi:uncharacterized protein
MSSVGYHEPVEELPTETRDMHRALVSLMEELEAVDWYNQRAAACRDSELKSVRCPRSSGSSMHPPARMRRIPRRWPFGRTAPSGWRPTAF